MDGQFLVEIQKQSKQEEEMDVMNREEAIRHIDFQKGATLLVDKPEGWTSFDVVNKLRFAIRKKLKVKKIKVGHSGTLDPMATGLLIICTGKFTKKLHEYQGLDKEYEGTLKLGATTPSYDRETPIDAEFPTGHITPDMLEEARQSFLGSQEQYPPMFSAIKVDGQPLYKKAREGKKVEVQARPVIIHDFQLTKVEMPRIDFYVHCSKGTYVRSLAHDFGKTLQSGAYLTRLVRTSIGPFQLKDAWNLEELVAHIQND